ncbi:hypothetical protein CPT_Sansa55 [Caulobacter phage Sansa]|uniref:DUF1643 domain-containing protein n=1 Tax=Caulobacter phage Sansa TaxID=1675600 RepID=A0A0K1LLY0_9CAUD|nr:hypothetical protein HOR07_gp055 [Caulobacter phage Sansa]AKU43459.1 hypothetical protein CPT_Sansa55 [Caulobacter phage Sansa]
MTAAFEASKRDAVRKAVFTNDRKGRLTLSVIWDVNKPILGWAMANPSWAGEDSNDMTFNRVWWFTARSGRWGGFVIVNSVPYVAADAAECREWCKNVGLIKDSSAKEMLKANVDMMIALAPKVDAWVLAYGEVALTFGIHVNWMLDALRGGARPFYVLGVTSGGTPKHPMARGVHRIPDDAPFLHFDPRIRRLGDVAYPD